MSGVSLDFLVLGIPKRDAATMFGAVVPPARSPEHLALVHPLRSPRP